MNFVQVDQRLESRYFSLYIHRYFSLYIHRKVSIFCGFCIVFDWKIYWILDDGFIYEISMNILLQGVSLIQVFVLFSNIFNYSRMFSCFVEEII